MRDCVINICISNQKGEKEQREKKKTKNENKWNSSQITVYEIIHNAAAVSKQDRTMSLSPT